MTSDYFQTKNKTSSSDSTPLIIPISIRFKVDFETVEKFPKGTSSILHRLEQNNSLYQMVIFEIELK